MSSMVFLSSFQPPAGRVAPALVVALDGALQQAGDGGIAEVVLEHQDVWRDSGLGALSGRPRPGGAGMRRARRLPPHGECIFVDVRSPFARGAHYGPGRIGTHRTDYSFVGRSACLTRCDPRPPTRSPPGALAYAPIASRSTSSAKRLRRTSMRRSPGCSAPIRGGATSRPWSDCVRWCSPDDVVLDIGAGGGRYALPLALVSREVIAIEPSDGMRQVLSAGMAEHRIHNVQVVDGRWPRVRPASRETWR